MSCLSDVMSSDIPASTTHTHTNTHSAFTSTGNKKKNGPFSSSYSEIILLSPTSLEPKPFLKHSTT